MMRWLWSEIAIAWSVGREHGPGTAWYSLRWSCRSLLRERFPMWLAWRLPRWLVYWAAIRLMAHATTGRYGDQIVPELRAMDALERWRP